MITREERLKIIPPSMHTAYKKAPTSRRAAIHAFCQECAGYTRETIRECTAIACPLYAFRPYQTKDEEDETTTNEAVEA